ncbi:MAG: type 4 pilus major pilin [Terriglobia bacterium]|nr:type 4 pilus major pilin [Terriglobia bacterium]
MFTIIGLVVAVAAALILLVGVLHVGSGVKSNSVATNAAGELAQMALGIQSLYSGQASFASVTDTVAIDAGKVPSGMVAGTAIENEWGGAVTIGPATPATEFTIQEAEVPADACPTLVTQVSSATAISINGTALTLPADAGTVAADCNAASNTLIFTFGH